MNGTHTHAPDRLAVVRSLPQFAGRFSLTIIGPLQVQPSTCLAIQRPFSEMSCSLTSDFIDAEARERVTFLDRAISALLSKSRSVSRLATDLSELRGEFSRLAVNVPPESKSEFATLRGDIDALKVSLRFLPKPSTLCPFDASAPFKGIIAHLAQQYLRHRPER
jgi:hypothetical protein